MTWVSRSVGMLNWAILLDNDQKLRSVLNGFVGRGVCSVIRKTTYDHLETNDKTCLASVAGDYNKPSYLGGNVAKTENDNTATYFSYDVYGRIKWVVQDIKGWAARP